MSVELRRINFLYFFVKIECAYRVHVTFGKHIRNMTECLKNCNNSFSTLAQIQIKYFIESTDSTGNTLDCTFSCGHHLKNIQTLFTHDTKLSLLAI
jgi:hypothetical protein